MSDGNDTFPILRTPDRSPSNLLTSSHSSKAGRSKPRSRSFSVVEPQAKSGVPSSKTLSRGISVDVPTKGLYIHKNANQYKSHQQISQLGRGGPSTPLVTHAHFSNFADDSSCRCLGPSAERIRAIVLRILPVFAAVMASAHMLVISASKVNGKQQYLYVTVSFTSELLKLSFCAVAYMVDENISTDIKEKPLTHVAFFLNSLLYAVPALLYTIDNNIIFVILEYLDPATYSILWNTKIVSTAILFRIILRRRLSVLKWISIILLFIGVLTSQSGKVDKMAYAKKHQDLAALYADPSYYVGVLLCVIASTISSAAGVYSEWIMKRQMEQNFFLQNGQLYAYGVLFNGITLYLKNSEAILERVRLHE
jgi:drug/metabolite transporter (DMT)-like permease